MERFHNFLKAAYNGDTKYLENAIEQGQDVNEANADGDTALIIAARDGKDKIIEILLKNGADMKHKNEAGYTALTTAIDSWTYEETIEALVTAATKEDLDVHDPETGATPLITALINNDIATAELMILQKEVDVNLASKQVFEGEAEGSPPLHFCRNLEAVRFLIDNGADVNKQNKAGDTALHVLLSREDPYIIKYLLANGANPEIENNDGDTPFRVAQNLSPELADIIYSSTPHGLFLEAVQENNLEYVTEKLAEPDFDVNEVNYAGDTAIMVAFRTMENTEMMDLLLANGADIDHVNEAGLSVITEAMNREQGSALVMKYSLLLGANPNVHNPLTGFTPLIEAVALGELELVKYMLNEAPILADVNLSSIVGREGGEGGVSPLQQAGSYIDILKLLIDKGADINHTDAKRHPVLSYFVATGNLEAVNYLIEKGARTDIEYTDNRKRSPLYYAAKTGNEEMLRLLYPISHSADREFLISKIATFSSKIQEIINQLDDKSEPWTGFTQADAEKLDTIFGDEKIQKDYSVCPVCLKVTELTEACNYMTHDCSKLPGYYHKGLYEKYKNDVNHISWCTICSRICIGHNHYPLGPASGRKPAVEVFGKDPFEKDCRISSGGGGIMEKFLRFRRLREFALELQEEQGLSENYAMNLLVEETWNAPLVRKLKAPQMLKEKKWNHATSLFPKGEEPPQEEEVYPEILRPATERAPNIIDEGTNYVMDEPGIEVIQFHHRRADGSEYNHEHSMISADTLQGFIKAHEHIYEENFGYCYDKACGARLYPEEIKRFVNPKVYEVYRRLFNEKFKAPKKTGGARMNIFADAEAECVPVKKPAKGGKTKKQRFILKTRKNKQQNKNNSRKR